VTPDENINVEKFENNISTFISAIIDVNNTSRFNHLLMLQELQSLQSNLTINVVPESKVLEHYEGPTYFTSAFPTLFPWGTGKHIDNRRKGTLKMKKWIELSLKDSSRYYTLSFSLMHLLTI